MDDQAPKINLQTKFGEISVVLHDATRATVSDIDGLELRKGCTFSLSFEMTYYTVIDKWSGKDNEQNITTNRLDYSGQGHRPIANPKQLEQMIDAVLEAWHKYIKDDPGLCLIAQYRHINRLLSQQQALISVMTKDLAEAQAEALRLSEARNDLLRKNLVSRKDSTT